MLVGRRSSSSWPRVITTNLGVTNASPAWNRSLWCAAANEPKIQLNANEETSTGINTNTAMRRLFAITFAITGSAPVISGMESQHYRGVRVHGVVGRFSHG